jgi:hypothetical protein
MWWHSKFGSRLCKIHWEKHPRAFLKVVEGSGSTTFLFTTLCTSIQFFGDLRVRTGVLWNIFEPTALRAARATATPRTIQGRAFPRPPAPLDALSSAPRHAPFPRTRRAGPPVRPLSPHARLPRPLYHGVIPSLRREARKSSCIKGLQASSRAPPPCRSLCRPPAPLPPLQWNHHLRPPPLQTNAPSVFLWTRNISQCLALPWPRRPVATAGPAAATAAGCHRVPSPAPSPPRLRPQIDVRWAPGPSPPLSPTARVAGHRNLAGAASATAPRITLQGPKSFWGPKCKPRVFL